MPPDRFWPIDIEDSQNRRIYLTQERREHALGHPGMSDDLLQVVIETVQFGQRTQDKFDTTKYKYVWGSDRLPLYYSHMVVVVKFGWRGNPAKVNNFMLTAYMIEKW